MAEELRETEAKLQEALNTANTADALKCLKRINEEGWEVQIDYVPASRGDLSRSGKDSSLATSHSSKERSEQRANELVPASGRWLSMSSNSSETKAGASKSASFEDAQGIGQMPLQSFGSSNSAIQRAMGEGSGLALEPLEDSSELSSKLGSSRR